MAHCVICGQDCGPDRPGAVVAHLLCAARTAAMLDSGKCAQALMPLRANPLQAVEVAQECKFDGKFHFV